MVAEVHKTSLIIDVQVKKGKRSSVIPLHVVADFDDVRMRSVGEKQLKYYRDD